MKTENKIQPQKIITKIDTGMRRRKATTKKNKYHEKKRQRKTQQEEEVGENDNANVNSSLVLLDLPDLVISQIVYSIGLADALSLRLTSRVLCSFVISDCTIYKMIRSLTDTLLIDWEKQGSFNPPPRSASLMNYLMISHHT